jgi:hypothetical protein
MTTRHSGYVIALKEDIREDDVEMVIQTLHMIKGVIAVEPVISGPDVQIAEMRANARWRMRLAELIRNEGL